MSKRIPFLFFIILLVSTRPLPRAEALGIGPPSFELNLQMDGSNSTTFYVTSDGLNGQLIVGMEDLPFRVDPPIVNMSRDDVNVPVELTFYGNETLEPGVYEGKVTFLAYTGGFVAVGIKIRAKINLLKEVVSVDEVDVAESYKDTAETEPESEDEPETIAEEEEPEEELEAEMESESEEEPEFESQEMDYTPYVMGGAIVAVLVSAVIWWKRK